MLALLTALLPAAAVGQKQDNLFVTRYYSVEIPNGWVTDDTGLTQSKDNWELGYIYPPGDSTLCIYSELKYFREWSDVSLWKNDENEMAEYTRVLLKDYQEYAPEIVDTVTVGRIPFILLKLTDEGSCFYWAETMTNGYVVGFECYALDDSLNNYRNVMQSELETFIGILKTFQPIY